MYILFNNKVLDVDPDNQITQMIRQPNVLFTKLTQNMKELAVLDDQGYLYTLEEDEILLVSNQPDLFTSIDYDWEDSLTAVSVSGNIWQYKDGKFTKSKNGIYQKVLNAYCKYVTLDKCGVLNINGNEVVDENRYLTFALGEYFVFAINDLNQLRSYDTQWDVIGENFAKIKSDNDGYIFGLDKEGYLYSIYHNDIIKNVDERKYKDIYIHHRCLVAISEDNNLYYFNDDNDNIPELIHHDAVVTYY